MSRPKLLLADDSITIQKVVNLTFADQGMDVVAFSDGDAAIENLDSIKPDIVLADVHMPGINGYQLCELMRSDEANRRTPVVLLVGSFEPFDRDEADRVGANAHLTKPFTSIADLVSTVEGLLAESKSSDVPEPVQLPRPDTSDIDSLYEQSFVETIEMPQNGSQTIEYEMDAYDDEMIETSYAEPDLAPPVEESFYETEDFSAGPVEDSEIEAESLIAESMPKMDEAEVAEREKSLEPETVEVAAPETGFADSEPEEEEGSVERREGQAEDAVPEMEFRVQESEFKTGDSSQDSVERRESNAVAYDPFESLAAEPSPVSKATEIISNNPGRYNFADTDLLELPSEDLPRPVEYTVPDAGRQPDKEIVSLSPELIELIVQKVVERMSGKN